MLPTNGLVLPGLLQQPRVAASLGYGLCHLLQHPSLTKLPGCVSVHTSSSNSEPAAAPKEVPQVEAYINNHRIVVPAGTTILKAAEKVGVHIPTLCKHPKLDATPGTCRVCCVDIGGGWLKAACYTPVTDGMKVDTDSKYVKEHVQGVLAMLRANHPEDCMTCDVNGRCEFQDMINKYKVPKWPKLMDVSKEYKEHHELWHSKDESTPALTLDKDKCIKCGRCVEACSDALQGMNVIGMFSRGRDTHIGFLGDGMMQSTGCISCGQCASVCPVGALYEHEEWRTVLDLLENKRKIMVVQTAPAVRVAIGEEMGLEPGTISTGQMVAGLRRIGFDQVFDTDFSADLTIMEEGTELLQRLGKAWAANDPKAGPLPMFTSCCPGWVNLMEKQYPELLPHLSTAKSPQQMFGAVVKTYWAKKAGVKPEDIILVSVMPCTAKKYEANRPEMAGDETTHAHGHGHDHGHPKPRTSKDEVRHVDYVITTRELGALFRMKKVPMASLPHEKYDDPLGMSSSAAVLFGNTGGVMEAAVRTVYEVVTGDEMPIMKLEAVRGLAAVKEATLSLKPKGSDEAKDVRVAVVSGIHNVTPLLERVKAGEVKYDFIEVMACPGGCVGGGGQPRSKDPEVVSKRAAAVYRIDDRSQLRKSHKNPRIQQLYEEFFKAPCSEVSHALLHTTYKDRSGFIGNWSGAKVPHDK